MTQQLREQVVHTAKRMSALGLAPGTSGNASVRRGDRMLITPSGLAYDDLIASDVVEVALATGAVSPGARVPSSEWQLHRELYRATPAQAIVHTHSLFCTAVSMVRRPIPAVHYTVVLAGGDDIPCAEYATFGSGELARNVAAALAGGRRACLMANHGMVAIGDTLAAALRLASEIETLAAQYWHAAQLGAPHVLDRGQLDDVRARFATYGQPRSRSKS